MKSVTIMLHDDGTFMVREEEMAEEMAEPMEGGQTFDNADDAMQAAMQMLRGEGASEEEAAGAMQSGYKSVAGNRSAPAAGSTDVKAVFGE